MYTIWTQHLKTEDEKEAFRNEIKSARRVLARLKQICEDREQQIQKEERSVTIFDKPNWEYRQAWSNGSMATIASMKQLVDLDQQERPKEN